MKLLTKRLLPIIWEREISLKATLTSELQDIGFDPKMDDLEKGVLVSVVENGDKRKIIIEKV